MLSSRIRQCSRCLGRFPPTAAKLRPFLDTIVRYQSTSSNTASPDSDHHVSSSLLQRARAMAAEHHKLSVQNLEVYDLAMAKRIGELGPVTAALKEYEDAQHALEELRTMLSDSDPEIRALAETDLNATNATLPQLSSTLKHALIPPHPFSPLPCLLELHPGAGGSEASIFAHDLLQMYIGLCTRLSLPHTITSYSVDDSAPAGSSALSDAILEITAPGAYDLLRSEAGVHRVQRIPATEKKGRTHTSAVSVLVLPLLPETGAGDADSELNYNDPTSDYYISTADVRSEVMRARGAGGQHVNKTESAVRLTHMPTGIVVAMQDNRSQHKNREKAWQILRAKIAARRREEREKEVAELRRTVMGGVGRMGREDKVRTYNYSQSRVTDHRSGVERSDLDGVLEGGLGLEKIMESVREWLREGEVLGLLAEDELKRKLEDGGGPSTAK